jgi:hypothetical protein
MANGRGMAYTSDAIVVGNESYLQWRRFVATHAAQDIFETDVFHG